MNTEHLDNLYSLKFEIEGKIMNMQKSLSDPLPAKEADVIMAKNETALSIYRDQFDTYNNLIHSYVKLHSI